MEKLKAFLTAKSSISLLVLGLINSVFCALFVGMWRWNGIIYLLMAPLILLFLYHVLCSKTYTHFFKTTLFLCITFIFVGLPLVWLTMTLITNSIPDDAPHSVGPSIGLFALFLFVGYILLSITIWLLSFYATYDEIKFHNPQENEIYFRPIDKIVLDKNMLLPFNRYQKITNDWIPTEDGSGYKLILQPHIEDWDKERKRDKVKKLHAILSNGGKIFGAYTRGRLVGFAAIDGTLLGSTKQYIELAELHVTYEYRGRKIGKNLFKLCTEAAKHYGCSKLYIVASTSEETQKAYKKLGCVYATERIPHLYEQRPGDVHMEYVL